VDHVKSVEDVVTFGPMAQATLVLMILKVTRVKIEIHTFHENILHIRQSFPNMCISLCSFSKPFQLFMLGHFQQIVIKLKVVIFLVMKK
jgi:hypothetical protein